MCQNYMSDVAINMHVRGLEYQQPWHGTCSTQSVKHSVYIGTLHVM
jgi:hypothetical protein